MNITADTNVLVRIVMQDDAEQATVAQALFLQATVIAIPLPVFCEFVWVLKRGYASSVNDIVSAIEAIVEIDAVVTDLPAVEAGLTALRAGGDFADGALAYQGETLGGTVFASFDRNAVALLRNEGAEAADPAELIA